VLSEPIRLRLLALASDDELSIGELADLLGEGQPNVSRHAAALRQTGLLSDRREGTRTLVRLAADAARDAVVADALVSGRALCEKDGSLARIADVLRAREAAAHEFFARPGKPKVDALPMEMGAYLVAVGALLPRHSLAVDAGTGDGRLLEVVAPLFERVVAVDRSEAQLARARERALGRGFRNVTFVQAELDDPKLQRMLAAASEPRARSDARICGQDSGDLGRPPRLRGVSGASAGGADVVFASRMLHHAPQPARVVMHLAALCAPGGAVVVIDYAHHHDESLRDQADAWLGFEPADLRRFARGARLEDARVIEIPSSVCGDGPDKHLPWQALVARVPSGGEPAPRSRPRRGAAGG
jgi:DNA-binding transcriptional ArsR family regulator